MFEWLFKYPADVYRQAEFAFASGLAPAWWLLIALVGAALVAASALRGERLARWRTGRRLVVVGLQAAAVSVVVAVLAEPTLTLRQLKPGANTVAVLVDASASMGLASGDGAVAHRARAPPGGGRNRPVRGFAVEGRAVPVS